MVLLPAFNHLAEKNLSFNLLNGRLLEHSQESLYSRLISGSYPALFLSGFKPIAVLKGKLKSGKSILLSGIV